MEFSEGRAPESSLIMQCCKIYFQDGVIECSIPSVDLYPIHHLDELEFFPGDFVIRNTGKILKLFQSFFVKLDYQCVYAFASIIV